MLRIGAVLLLVLALGGYAAGAATTRSKISLTVVFWPQGQGTTQVKRWTLRCGPLGGTLPRRAAACRRLQQLGTRVFAPVSRDAICTEIWGGPEVGRIKGRVGTRTVWATFNRTNGCQIARWDRVSPWLLPAGGA
jgi:hypothetical protein